jgi:FKBP-type peptidyl-prolyl cis-trans isomerase SlyD
MQVAHNRVVSIDYTLKDEEGHVLDSSEAHGALAYLHGAGNIVPGLEEALHGREEGERISVQVSPEQAYGEKDESLQQSVPREAFQTDMTLEPGMRFQATGPHGTQLITVVDVQGDQVTIDANHPLAGQTLNFEVKIVGVRDATEGEVTQGQPEDDPDS